VNLGRRKEEKAGAGFSKLRQRMRGKEKKLPKNTKRRTAKRDCSPGARSVDERRG